MSLPFIGYGAAPDFTLNDITSLRLTSLVSGFERENSLCSQILIALS